MNMPVQMIELEEVQTMEVRDVDLEQSSGVNAAGGTYTPASYCVGGGWC
jgi:hypothetical protein